MTALPPGVTEKLRRAELHRRDFDRRIDRFFEAQTHRILREDYPEAGKSLWRVKILREPPISKWSGLAGELLYDLRSALDQLAYALAISYSGDPLLPKIAQQSAFPLFENKPKDPTRVTRRIQGMDPKAQALIMKMQPYTLRRGRRDEYGRSALGYLDRLCNYDKHRLPLVMGYRTGALAWFGEARGDPFEFVNYGPFEDGAVVAEAKIAPGAKMTVNPLINLILSFDPPGPAGMEASMCFRWLAGTVERTTDRFKPFL